MSLQTNSTIAANALSVGSTLFAPRDTKDFTGTDLPLVNPSIIQRLTPHSTVVVILAVG